MKTLSGGNQQKALLARWMLADPRVAIFDEPTRGVDVGAKESIYEIIEALAADGLAALVISSELEELVRLCDRVCAVYEGQIVGELAGPEATLEALGQLVVGGDVTTRVKPAPSAQAGARERNWKWLLRRREVQVLLAIVLIIAASTAAHPYFWSSGNLAFIFADSVVITLLALGESFVMLGRGIDLSVGSMMGLAAIIVGFRIQDHGMTLIPAVLLGAAIGLVLGLGNGILVGAVRLPGRDTGPADPVPDLRHLRAVRGAGRRGLPDLHQRRLVDHRDQRQPQRDRGGPDRRYGAHRWARRRVRGPRRQRVPHRDPHRDELRAHRRRLAAGRRRRARPAGRHLRQPGGQARHRPPGTGQEVAMTILAMPRRHRVPGWGLCLLLA
jgi:hypothetical protein